MLAPPSAGLSWADSLVKLPAEGFYMLRKALAFEGGEWPKAALVQLGYTRAGEPILFIGQVRAQLVENDLWFFGSRSRRRARSARAARTAPDLREPAAAGAHTTGVH